MKPGELEGSNLGEKHKYYNELMKTAIVDYPLYLSPIDYSDSDVNNMLKIDVACSRKDINYVLQVLKCVDMLYVCKAIKKINWLLTDEYTYIINPQYLNTELFPEMTMKARNKFLLHLRLNLKNENRVEEFFNYYKNINIKEALKWLYNCSLTFIENAIKIYNNEININILKRLCEKSIKLLGVYLNCKKNMNVRRIMQATIFLMHKHLEEYLNMLESYDKNVYPTFSPRCTSLLMKKAPQKIIKNFQKYARRLHLQTFVKYIKPEMIKNILLTDYDKSNTNDWFNEHTLDTFVRALPKQTISDFVRINVIEKTNEPIQYFMLLAIPKDSYRWYKYIEFEIAFKDIIKLIKAESSSSERMMMMEVLLLTAKHNMKHVEKLLQYFRENHINETLIYKRAFVMSLMEQIDTFRLGDQAWDNLHVLFLSMEDIEYGIQDKNYIKASIIRKIINNESVPDVTEKYFYFETMISYRKKLNNKECDMIFNYLYECAIKKLKKQKNISNEIEYKKKVTLLENVLLLLSDWEKDIANFPVVVTSMTKLIDVKKIHFKHVNLSNLYNVKKSWRKTLFSISLDLSLYQEVCLNALKHDSKLLLNSNHMISLIDSTNSTNLQKLLNKIRIYWPASAHEAISLCLEMLNNRGDKALIKHLMYLLPVNLLKETIIKYIPEEETIDWNEDNKLLLNVRKNIAKHIHIARPQPHIELVLGYAKGDYLQFAMPSINAILYNMNETNTRICIELTLNAPVSLKKHLIRIAIDKLKYNDVIQLFGNIWNVNKNKSIRSELFKTTFKLLCKEKDICAVNSIWTLLEIFIGTLNDKENFEIYNTLTKANEVPFSIKAVFWKRCIQFFKSLPPSSNQKSYLERVLFSSKNFVDIVDTNVLSEIILEHFEHNKSMKCTEFIVTCIISNTIETHLKRYNKIFYPIMEMCVTSWQVKKDNRYIYRTVLNDILSSLCKISKQCLAKQMILPNVVFKKFLIYLEENLPTQENYVLLRTLKFSYKLINIIALNSSQNVIDSEDLNGYYESVISKAVPQLGEEIQNCLRKDIKRYYSSIYICLSNAIHSILVNFNLFKSIELLLLNSILCVDLKESYLLVLELIQMSESFVHSDESILEILDIISLHPSSEVKFHYYNRRNAKFY